MSLSSPNRMVWAYFRSLRRLVQRIAETEDSPDQKDDIVLSIFMAVTVVEAFVNLFFRILVTEQLYQQHEKLVLDDLDTSHPQGPKGLKYKLNHWPPKVLHKTLVWQSGVPNEFEQLRELRNLLMHVTSSHQWISVPGFEIHGLADTSVYDNLTVGDARKALEIAEGMVQELLRLRGVQDQQMGGALHHWIGKVPI
jgi:hypothetical protein